MAKVDKKYKHRAIGKVVREGMPTMYVTHTGGWFADVEELLRDEKVQRLFKEVASLFPVSDNKGKGSS